MKGGHIKTMSIPVRIRSSRVSQPSTTTAGVITIMWKGPQQVSNSSTINRIHTTKVTISTITTNNTVRIRVTKTPINTTKDIISSIIRGHMIRTNTTISSTITNSITTRISTSSKITTRATNKLRNSKIKMTLTSLISMVSRNNSLNRLLTISISSRLISNLASKAIKRVSKLINSRTSKRIHNRANRHRMRNITMANRINRNGNNRQLSKRAKVTRNKIATLTRNRQILRKTNFWLIWQAIWRQTQLPKTWRWRMQK